MKCNPMTALTNCYVMKFLTGWILKTIVKFGEDASPRYEAGIWIKILDMTRVKKAIAKAPQAS